MTPTACYRSCARTTSARCLYMRRMCRGDRDASPCALTAGAIPSLAESYFEATPCPCARRCASTGICARSRSISSRPMIADSRLSRALRFITEIGIGPRRISAMHLGDVPRRCISAMHLGDASRRLISAINLGDVHSAVRARWATQCISRDGTAGRLLQRITVHLRAFRMHE